MRIRAIAAILLTGCTTPPDSLQPLQDKALASALVGAWCNSDDGGKTCWAYDVFKADGTLRACGRFPDERRAFDGEGLVSVSGNVMCYRVRSATENFWVKPGSSYCTRILGVSRNSHTYQDMESGAKFSLTRVRSEAVTCSALAQ